MGFKSFIKRIILKLQSKKAIQWKGQPQQERSNRFSSNRPFPPHHLWIMCCKPDGSCQFSALAKALAAAYGDSKISPELVRRQICDYLEQLPPESAEFEMSLETTKYSFSDSTNSTLLRKVEKLTTPYDLATYFRNPKTYGNAATLQSARQLYDLDIFVVDSRQGNIISKVEGKEPKPNIILLIFDPYGKHFDLLCRVTYPDGNRNVQTIFSEADFKNLNLLDSSLSKLQVSMEQVPRWK